MAEAVKAPPRPPKRGGGTPAPPSRGGTTAALTRKLGPLPLYAWAGLVVVGYLVWRHFHPSSSSALGGSAANVGGSGTFIPGSDQSGSGASDSGTGGIGTPVPVGAGAGDAGGGGSGSGTPTADARATGGWTANTQTVSGGGLATQGVPVYAATLLNTRLAPLYNAPPPPNNPKLPPPRHPGPIAM